MNETTPQALTKREVTNIIRGELNFLKEVYKTNDLINRMEAIKLLGISPRSFTTYISAGFIKYASENAAGTKFFSRRELLGLNLKQHKKKV